jgi:CxxC motif-containing protein (DUF1111 family)
MPQKRVPYVYVFALLGLLALAGIAQQTFPDAPAAFATPTLSQNPGSQSISNGLPESVAGDTFALDQAVFEKRHGIDDGLGPVYNATACVDCHQNPVTGGPSQITEIRAGHLDATGTFINATVPIEGGLPIGPRSIVNDRSICAQAHEQLPDTENIRALRAVLNTLGDGFVEAIDDATLVNISTNQIQKTHGRIHGEPVMVTLFEAAPGAANQRVGRFGWKDQHASLLSFAADAYLNEIGITSRLRLKDTTSVCKTTTDPEDQFDTLGMEDIDHFAQFMRATQAPPPDTTVAGSPDVMAGQALFNQIGCATCHVANITTAAPGKSFAGGAYVVPAALGNVTIHPYGDFLLHDIGTGDGIVQGGPPDTITKLRTAPLWGVRTKTRFMHDLKSESLADAIRRHRGEAGEVSERFSEDLTPTQQQQLIAFLNSL